MSIPETTLVQEAVAYAEQKAHREWVEIYRVVQARLNPDAGMVAEETHLWHVYRTVRDALAEIGR